MKLHIPLSLKKALALAIACCSLAASSTYAATWDAATTGEQTLTGSGETIVIDGSVDLGSGDIVVSEGTWLINGSDGADDLTSSGDIIVNGGSLTFQKDTDVSFSGVLDINAGVVQFGDAGINHSGTAAFDFSEVQIAEGAQFINWSLASDYADTDFSIEGGTLNFRAMGPNHYMRYGQLSLSNGASGAASQMGFNWDSKLRFTSITGDGDLEMVYYNQGGGGALHIELGYVNDYGGTISASSDIAPRVSTFIISGAHTQSAGVIATFNDVNVTGEDFSLSGAGGITIEQNLTLTGAHAAIHGGTLSVGGNLSGTVNLNVNAGATFIANAAGLTGYEGDLVLNGGTLSISDAANLSKTLTIGSAGGTFQSTSDVVLSNTISFAGADSALGSYTVDFGAQNVDLSSATLSFADMLSGTYTLFTSTGTIDIEGIQVSGVSGRGSYHFDSSTSNSVILNLSSAVAQNLDWGTGAGTWTSTIDGARDWQGSAADNRYYEGDLVTFSSASGGSVDIQGTVNPGSLLIEGSGDWAFSEGSIVGDASLMMNGTGTVTLNAANSYAGGTNINSGIVVVNTSSALGSGAVTVAQGATLGLGYSDALSELSQVTFATGSTIELTLENGIYTGGLKDTLASGVTLKAGSNLGTVTIQEDNVAGSTGAGSTLSADYFRSTEGYTVYVGENTTLIDQVRLALGGPSTTTVSGQGTYQIDSVVLSGVNGASNLTVEEGATLRIAGTTLSAEGGDGWDGNNRAQGSFQISENGNRNTVNVYGTLESYAGISSRDGSGQINVGKQDGSVEAALILREGLAAVSNSNGKSNLDVYSGARLELYDQGTTSDHANILGVTLHSGATLAYGDQATGTVNVYTTVGFADNSTVTVQLGGSSTTLAMQAEVHAGTINLTGGYATLAFNGANNSVASLNGAPEGWSQISTSGTLALGSASNLYRATLSDADASIGISGEMGFASGITIGTAKTRSADDATITAKSGSVAHYVDGLQTYGVVIDKADINGGGAAYSIGDTDINNSSLTDIKITVNAGSVVISNSTLTRVELSAGAASDLTLARGSIVRDSIINAGVHVEGGVTFDASGSSIEGATVTQDTYASFTTTEGHTLTNLLVYKLGGIDALVESATGSYTLDVILTEAQMASFMQSYVDDGGIVLFELTDVDALGTWYNNITLSITDGTESFDVIALGAVATGGNVVLYIPEPSTATLSLLALAGLLARRRRSA